MKNTATGNFGTSFSLYPRSVADVVWERLPRTLVLFVTAAVISFYLGFALGKIIAWRRGSLAFRGDTLFSRPPGCPDERGLDDPYNRVGRVPASGRGDLVADIPGERVHNAVDVVVLPGGALA